MASSDDGGTRYGLEYLGHAIELIFNKKALVLNDARVLVDGVEVDRASKVYGEHDLVTTLSDGTRLRIEIGTGLTGELHRCVLVTEDGMEEPMAELHPPGSGSTA